MSARTWTATLSEKQTVSVGVSLPFEARSPKAQAHRVAGHASGEYAEAYCNMAATEAVLDCCEGLADCDEDHHPGTCSVGCAER